MGGVLQAVLLDMDGTLVDTEPYWMAAEFALVESFGGRWSDARAHALVGNALPVSAEYLRAHGGVDLAPEKIIERLVDAVSRAAEQEIPWRPGAIALLAGLAEAEIACALVTMSYERLVRTVTSRLPAGTFATVVTGEQVSFGKPHPEAYLTAAARLGVDPTFCVAIEDSPTGVASAQAAGCVVVAVPHHLPIAPAAGRTVVDSLAQLDAAGLDQLVQAQRLGDTVPV
jgi:HAD superfamily hydrolase (TIGR01509 family)